MSNGCEMVNGSEANSFNLGSMYSLSKTISPVASFNNYHERWPFTEEERWRKKSNTLFGASDSSSS